MLCQRFSNHLAYVLSLFYCFRYYVFELTTRNPNNDFFIKLSHINKYAAAIQKFYISSAIFIT